MDLAQVGMFVTPNTIPEGKYREMNSRPLCASRPNAVTNPSGLPGPVEKAPPPRVVQYQTRTSSIRLRRAPIAPAPPVSNEVQPQSHRSHGKGKENSRDILYPILVLDDLPDLVGQLARDLDGVYPGDVGVEALPLRDPAALRVREGDDALEDLGGAGLDLVLRVGEVQEVVAVGAAFVAEALGGRLG